MKQHRPNVKPRSRAELARLQGPKRIPYLRLINPGTPSAALHRWAGIVQGMNICLAVADVMEAGLQRIWIYKGALDELSSVG